MRKSALFGGKTSDFSKFRYVRTDKGGGVEPLQTFFGQERI